MNIFIRYINVGILNSILGLAIIVFCLNILNIHYSISYFVGYFIGSVNSFLLNKRYTFKSTAEWNKELVPFIVVFIISYFISHVVLIVFIEKLYLDKNIAVILSMVVYTIIGYILNKKVFKGENVG